MNNSIDTKFDLQNYSRGNNAICVTIGDLDLYYSYSTIVAFRHGSNFFVCENIWSATTGKHINDIDGRDKAGRLSREDFLTALKELMEELNL